MTSYTIEWTDGRVEDIIADDDRQAVRTAKTIIGIDAVFGDWDQRQDGDRMLIWETEAEANNDSGSNAVAQIVRCNV